ncbi:uncharacterized protein [Rutidosis leptorrhynchoides]|uniref:uncharacterized protein isoform X1 n=1 Tax=Rutidosis leptorrhynchoides TaxID=125765 RepID=UPI003A99CF29
MGAKSKKSASKADAIVAEPTKSIKKGKRDAEEIIEKHAASSKKQKKDVKKVVPKKAAADVVNKPVKESTSDESDSSSDDDAGKVVEVNFVGYAHVTFATPDAAQKALKLNGKDLVGRPVELDLPKGRGAKTQQKKDVKKQKEPKPTRKSIEESDSHDSSSSSESEEEKGPKRTRQYIEGAADDDIADTSTEESDSSHDTTSSEALLLAYYAKQIDSSEEEMADAEPTKSIKKGNIFLPLIVNRCMLYICMRFCCKDGLNFFEF